MPLHVRVLGSSSSGNCTVVWDGTHALLVDCGFSPRYTFRNLRVLGLGPSNLTGVLITHTHGDHFNEGVLGFLVEWRVPICAPESVAADLIKRSPAARTAANEGLLRTFCDGSLEIAWFDVGCFEVPHDSPGGCYGYAIAHVEGQTRRTVSVATDVGFTGEHLRARFTDTDAIVFESNHDPMMLENSGRPEWLKQRIRKIGHLSNQQCAGFLADVFHHSTRPPAAVVLAHISQTCNTNALALECTHGELHRNGFSRTLVVESFRMTANKVVTVK
ncbi:MAG: yycJ [Bacteroidetes bacterium]|jgi:phosphoribosyl 1,2-cyclic phosphodiesterase|nr:yycJ [Bacteroidota bacterium]